MRSEVVTRWSNFRSSSLIRVCENHPKSDWVTTIPSSFSDLSRSDSANEWLLLLFLRLGLVLVFQVFQNSKWPKLALLIGQKCFGGGSSKINTGGRYSWATICYNLFPTSVWFALSNLCPSLNLLDQSLDTQITLQSVRIIFTPQTNPCKVCFGNGLRPFISVHTRVRLLR